MTAAEIRAVLAIAEAVPELGIVVDHRRPWATHIGEFGAHRLMLASNWPVIELRSPYERAWHDLTGAVETLGIGTAELADLRGNTAARWYRLA